VGVLLGFVSFAVFFGLHVAIWRVRVPARPYGALALLWAGVFAILLAALWLMAMPPTLPAALYAVLLGGSLTLSYLFFYVGIKHDSPSLAILRELQMRGPSGIEADDVEAFARRRPFVTARLEELISDGFVRRDAQGVLYATGKVTAVVRLNEAYRALTGQGQRSG